MISEPNKIGIATLVFIQLLCCTFGYEKDTSSSRVGRSFHTNSTQSFESSFPVDKKIAHDFFAQNETEFDHHYKWNNDKGKQKGTKVRKRKKKGRLRRRNHHHLYTMTHIRNTTFGNDLSNTNIKGTALNNTDNRSKSKFGRKNKHKKIKGKHKRHKDKNLHSKTEKGPTISDDSLLRGKRLSLYPMPFGPHRRRGRGGGGGTRSLLGSHDWMRSLHRHHQQLAATMRDQINGHIERTRQQWLHAVNPHATFFNGIPTFPEMPEQIIPTFPSFYSFVPSLKRKKNSIPIEPESDKRYFEHSTPKSFDYGGQWGETATRSTPPAINTPKTTKEQKQFKVTRSKNGNEITPFVSTTETNLFNKFYPDESNSIWPKPRKGFIPKTPTVNTNNKPSMSPTNSSHTPSRRPDIEEEIEDRWRSTHVPYGNDISKGISKDILNKGKEFDRDWEWITMVKGENDVNYGYNDNDEGGINKRENDGKPTVEDSDNTDVEDDKKDFDLNHCLKCPAKRTVHAPRGQDYVPLFIPTPHDACHQSGVLRYHVEVGPGYPKPGSMLGEGHYYINVSILGGTKGKTPLKACTYDYEVQVYKCPSLPNVSGGQVECSAGDAWGSKCFWKCEKGKKLVGSTFSTCGGHKKSPTWLNDPPTCEEVGCPIPKGLESVSLSCSLPIPHESLHKRLDTMNVYPKGTKCQIHCKTGYTSDDEYGAAVKVSKCLANGKWSPDIQTCCKKKKILPEPFHDDCNDINVQINGIGSVHLVPPRFFTSSGKSVHVWCDIETVRVEGRHCRTCKAHDKAKGLTASCRQCINVSSKLGCPSIQAPKNGNLECRNTAEGDIMCKITCKNGYFLPPYISSGSVRCPRGMSLWDFQSFREERLPSCILR